MDANEFDLTAAFRPPEAAAAHARPRPPSLLRATWSGAKAGFRWTSYIIGPITAAFAVLGLALATFGIGFGEGWGLPRVIVGAAIFYVGCSIYGVIIGGLVGLIAGLVQKAVARTLPASWRHGTGVPLSSSLETERAEPPTGFEPPARGRWIWPWLIGVPALLALALAFAAGAFLPRVVDRRLADAEAEADRDDPYWRLDDLMAHRDPIPDAENSAIVIGRALALLPKDWPQGEAREGDERLSGIVANVRLDDAMAKSFRREVDTYREAVEMLRTVANYRRGRHELELGPTLIDTPLTETQAARTAARVLQIDAALRVHDGDPDAALDSCRAILGVARSIGDEPFAISQLVRVALGEVAMSGTRRVLGQGEPSDAALAQLEALILDELDQPLLVHGLRGERATLTELIRRIGTGEVPISALSDQKFDPNAPRAAIAPWASLMFDNQRATALEWMNEAVAIARRPPGERAPLWAAWQARIDKVRHSRLGLFTSTLPLLLVPGISAFNSADLRYQANLGATAMLLAAERHRRKTGDWPVSIDAITPDMLPSRPLDPHSGQPFRLERRDGQFLIYSVGSDLKDEHGAYDPKHWREGGRDDVGTSGWDVPLRRHVPGR
jgi:hypothetical protein